MIIIVSQSDKARKAEMLQNVPRFTLNLVQHVAFWPPCYGKENKARNVTKCCTIHSQTHATRCISEALPQLSGLCIDYCCVVLIGELPPRLVRQGVVKGAAGYGEYEMDVVARKHLAPGG